jgi:uncharacterized protein (DUF362 family)/ferredoxin-like protein FixX
MVYIEKASYSDEKKLFNTVCALLDSAGGQSIKPGDKVLIKPNMLAAHTPEQAITTHPQIVRAVARYALEHSANVQVSDSGAVGGFDLIAKLTGMTDALGDLPVKLVPLENPRAVESKGPYPSINLSADALDADMIINLPKLKTHCQMQMTLAVKNLFGCVVGHEKQVWHYRVGEDKALFAQVLASIFEILQPGLNLIDGIMGMEGEGPGTSGIPREMGVLLASSDALEMDMVISKMAGLRADELLTTHAALDLLPERSREVPELIGESIKLDNLILPSGSDMLFGPKFTRSFMRKHIATRPINVKAKCKLCDECVKICPANAISNTGSSLKFDYEQCIRCYCCVEICPHSAMTRQETIVKRTIQSIIRLRS